ncbi:hypothetical protein ACWD01_36970 [Streptomyces sp. NPDC002835]
MSVTAAPTGANPVDELPPAPLTAPQVAAYVSPPYAEYAKLILKVSHNLGGNLTLCNMAVAAGSSDCMDGFPRAPHVAERGGRRHVADPAGGRAGR